MSNSRETFWHRVINSYLDRCRQEHTAPHLGELASQLGISPSTLSRSFRKATGERPNEYLRKRRLEHVAALLVATDLSIERIIQDAAFDSRSCFFREFSAMYAMTPNEYRRRQRAGRR